MAHPLWLTTLYVWSVDKPIDWAEGLTIGETVVQKGPQTAVDNAHIEATTDSEGKVVKVESRCYGKPDGHYADLICETIEVDDCDHEDGEPTSYEKPVSYVSVYAVTRHYGGPEEGGWWYNWKAHELSIPLIEPGNPLEIEKVKAFLRERFPDDGNIYSVRGGVEYNFEAECKPGGSASKERPHYE